METPTGPPGVRGGRRRRGRRPRLPDAPLTACVCVRLSAGEASALRHVAGRNQVSLTAFIREAIAEAVADCEETPAVLGRSNSVSRNSGAVAS